MSFVRWSKRPFSDKRTRTDLRLAISLCSLNKEPKRTTETPLLWAGQRQPSLLTNRSGILCFAEEPGGERDEVVRALDLGPVTAATEDV